MNEKHIAIPYYIDHDGITIISKGGRVLATCHEGMSSKVEMNHIMITKEIAEANAQYFIRAANHFEEAVEGYKAFLSTIKDKRLDDDGFKNWLDIIWIPSVRDLLHRIKEASRE